MMFQVFSEKTSSRNILAFWREMHCPDARGAGTSYDSSTPSTLLNREKPSGHLCLSVSWGYWQEIANKYLSTWCLNSAPRSLRQCFLAGFLLIFIEVRKWGKVFTEHSGETWGGQFKAGLSYRYVRPCLKKRRGGIEKGRGRDEKSPLLAPDSEAVWSGETVRSLCTERKRGRGRKREREEQREEERLLR